jgi:tryptophan synthase alpha chain
MSIKKYIEQKNYTGEKVLSIFLTAGFPDKEKFLKVAEGIILSGCDILELGIPFSDPLADGPIIQYSSAQAIKNGANADFTFEVSKYLKSKYEIPIIAMCYANTIVSYQEQKFFHRCLKDGIDGVIVPDVPLEESEDFFSDCDEQIQKILLCSPTSTEDRIKKIDEKSQGFVYCVSVTGVTGERNKYEIQTIEKIKLMRKNIKKNKMLIGFGVSGPESIQTVKDLCDGVIVGSSIIKKIINSDGNYEAVFSFVKQLKRACKE